MGLNLPREEETKTQLGTKLWQRNYRRPRIHPRQNNQNLPSEIHTTVKFLEGKQCFDSTESRKNLLIFQERMLGARNIYRTKCQSPHRKQYMRWHTVPYVWAKIWPMFGKKCTNGKDLHNFTCPSRACAASKPMTESLTTQKNSSKKQCVTLQEKMNGLSAWEELRCINFRLDSGTQANRKPR